MHDQRLKSFIEQEGLYVTEDLSDNDTFFNHSGKGTSQIDYIFATDKKLMKSTIIDKQVYNNSSAHVMVTGILAIKAPKLVLGRKREVNRKAVKKFYWEQGDCEVFNKLLHEKISSIHQMWKMKTYGCPSLQMLLTLLLKKQSRPNLYDYKVLDTE